MNGEHFDGAFVPTPRRCMEGRPSRTRLGATTSNGATAGAIVTDELFMAGASGPAEDANSFEIDGHGVTAEERPATVAMADIRPKGHHDAAARLEVDGARVSGVVVRGGRQGVASPQRCRTYFLLLVVVIISALVATG